MNWEGNGHLSNRWLLGALAATALTAIAASLVSQSIVRAQMDEDAAGLGLLGGSYSCSNQRYVPDYARPDVFVVETQHQVGFTGAGRPPSVRGIGSGGSIRPPGGVGQLEPAIFPSFPTFTTASFGASSTFRNGTRQDCVALAEQMATRMHRLGCETSTVHASEIPYYPVSLTFVCQGEQADLLQMMAELSRSVVTARLPNSGS